MKISFRRKIRKLGPEKLVNIPEEIRDFSAGETVIITPLDSGLLITKRRV